MSRKMKAWLKKNPLTPNENDFTILIESFGSVNLEEIIEALRADGMELKPETVLDVVTRFNKKCIDLALNGHTVSTGLVYMKAAVKGAAYDKTWNPERNRLHIAISQGLELRKAVAETTVEIMGEHPDPIALYGITDLSTGKTDGSVTPGLNAELKGTYIRITGKEESCGLFMRNIDTSSDPIRIEPQYIAINDPSRILFVIPAYLTAGTYELHIVTQFTAGERMLKNPRSVTLGYPVTIG